MRPGSFITFFCFIVLSASARAAEQGRSFSLLCHLSFVSVLHHAGEVEYWLIRLLNEQRAVLEPILDYRLNASYANMNFNVPFVWKSAGKILAVIGIVVLVLWLVMR